MLLSRPKITLASLHLSAFTAQNKWSTSIKTLYLSVSVGCGILWFLCFVFVPSCLFIFSLPSTFLFLIFIHTFIHVSMTSPPWQLVWWEDIPPRSWEHPHEQRSWFFHCPSQSELSRWLLHLCQVSASHNIFLRLFLVNDLPSSFLTGILMGLCLSRSLHASS